MLAHLAVQKSSGAILGRPRTKDFDLPPRMQRRVSKSGARYYYVTHDRRWLPLGSDLARAKRLWADYEDHGGPGDVESLVERYVSDCMDDCARSTKKQYRAFSRTIVAEWGSLPADSLMAPDIAQWRDRKASGRGWANGVISLGRVAYAKGLEWGLCQTNPFALVQLNAMPVRERYLTDDEFLAIREKAVPWLRSAMSLGYITALRESDLVKLRWDEIGDTMPTRIIKTKVRQAFRMTDELKACLAECRARPILGLYVIADERGRRRSVRQIQNAWRAACVAAGVEAQFRDVRAKAATDAEADGQDYQRLLGHSSRKMSDRYLKAKRTMIVEPLRKRL